MAQPTINVFMDASSSKGLGGIFGDHWFSARCPCHFCNRDIQFKKISAILQAVIWWGHLWVHTHVIFIVDNMAVGYAVLSGTNCNSPMMNMLRMIVMLAAHIGFSYSSSWLPSESNLLADSASQFQYNWLFASAPYLQPKPG